MTIFIWILSVLLAAMFAMAGSKKVRRDPVLQTSFERFGYSTGFMLFIGAAELAAAVGLLLPPLRHWAALGLVPIMGGAVVLHLRARDKLAHTLPAMILLPLVAIVAWLG
jgi:putative oxidoreductase